MRLWPTNELCEVPPEEGWGENELQIDGSQRARQSHIWRGCPLEVATSLSTS